MRKKTAVFSALLVIFFASGHALSFEKNEAQSTKLKNQKLEQKNSPALRVGITAFNAADYRKAIQAFERVLKQDPNNTTARYNLAMSHFRLKHYKHARDHLKALYVDGVRHAQLQYSLAVSEKKLQRYDKARILFERLTNSKNIKLAEAAKKQLAKISNLRARAKLQKPVNLEKTTGKSGSSKSENPILVKKSQKDSSRYAFNLRVGGGYDDGVVNVVNDLVNDGDNFQELSFSGSWRSKRKSYDYWYAGGNAYIKGYEDSERFDYDLYALSIGRSVKVGSGVSRNDLRIEVSEFGGQPYLESVIFSSRYAQSLSKKMRLGFRFRAKSSEERSDSFAHLAGESYRLESSFKYKRNAKNLFEFKYRFDYADRGDLERDSDEGNTLINLSADRHSIIGSWRYKFSPNSELRTEASYRYSNFSNSFIINDAEDERRDRRLTLRSEFQLNLSSNITASIGYRHINNESSIPVYDYERNIAYLRFGLKF